MEIKVTTPTVLALSRSLKELATEYPKEYGKAFRTLGMSLRSRVQKAMKTGNIPVGSIKPLHQLTVLLKKADGKPKGFGGRLKDAVRYKCYGRGLESEVTIGFLDGSAAEAAKKMQSATQKSMTEEDRKRWHVIAYYQKRSGNNRLAQAIEDWLLTGNTKTKPERSFISPFFEDPNTSAEAVRIVSGRIKSILAKTKLGV